MMKHEGAGIDTHADTHHVAVIDGHGCPLGDVQVPATAGGYRQAVRFIGRWTPVDKVGVECTGSYGAGLTRELLAVGYAVVEVNRPNRFDRRTRGKTDVFDAPRPSKRSRAVPASPAGCAPRSAQRSVTSPAR